MKSTVISVIVATAFIGGALMLSKGSNDTEQVANANNVTVVNGTQIIEIYAKGGYQPRKSSAKAGIPTILRFNTKGTFDCSASVTIPSLGVSRVLSQTGTTDIEIGIPQQGIFKGMCGMGMYPFEIEFQSNKFPTRVS